jgi:CheY-like chemotaxis protein
MAKVALLIGVGEYLEDSGFKSLPAPPKDVLAMKRVLEHPEMGGFDEVTILVNPTQSEMAIKIETWLMERKSDDLAVLFYSGHGTKNERRELYFSAKDTRKQREKLIQSTAVSAASLNQWIQDNYVTRFVLILDCCFSGAFGNLLLRDDSSVNVEIENQLGSDGQVVLTSSSSLQYSFEEQGTDLSIYTRYIVEGIETGAADLDEDGEISIRELHDYASQRVYAANKNMTPRIICLKDRGFDIVVAKSPKNDPKLQYRKEVEKWAKQQSERWIEQRNIKFSIPTRKLLNLKKLQLNISASEAQKIETEVLQPFQEYDGQLKEYEDTLVETLNSEGYPFNPTIEEALKAYQALLALKPENAEAIKRRVLPVERIQQEVKRQESPKLQEDQANGTAEISTVLWADDCPNNNVYERQALEAVGINVVLAVSTEEALEKLNQQKFDAIISDMGRPPDKQAGYTLLDKLRSSGNQTPFVIYAGSKAPEHIVESRRRGAIGCTNNPNELFEMVLAAVGRRI